MTAEKMPLILDGAAMAMDLNDVNDLFGDEVALSLPVRTYGKQLHQRLDELRSRGCCQTISWSKSGTIASITQDGQALDLRFLRSHPDTGVWDLSEPTTCELVKPMAAVPLVHLEWGSTSTPELAVFDAVGRVSIISFPNSLNSPFIVRKWDTDTVDDMHAVVGSYWLPVAPSNQMHPNNVLHGPAVKKPNVASYLYENSFVHATGPNHPHTSKSALFCVTIGGSIKMFWSQNNNRIEETTMELESVCSSDELVTHASMASDKKYLLVAIASSSKQLKLLKLEIQWSGPGSQPDKNPLPQNARLNPSLVEKRLAATCWLQDGPNDDATMAKLSHLQVLPSLMDNTGKNTAPPVIVAVRSRAPSEGAFQVAQSVLDRWEAVEQRQNLHSAFEQLGNKGNGASSELPSSMRLRKLDPIIINKVIIGFHTIQFGKVLVLTMADGTVEYRDRFTFEELYAEGDTNRIMNLRQVGWGFADMTSCLQTAFSPTNCSMVQIGDDGKLRWNKLHYPAGDIGDSMKDESYGASIAGLAISAAGAIWYHSNYDDMLAITQPFAAKRKFIQDWVTELIRILKIQVDYSEELHHDSLMRNSALQSCLSIMNSLGFRGELQPRSFQSKFAVLDLNLRNVVILITLSSNAPTTARGKISPLDEPEVVDVLAGCVKWSLDLLCWLSDCLFTLMNDEAFTSKLVPEHYMAMAQYLHERNDVSLHLLFSSCSRSFLSAVCKRIVHLEAVSGKAIEFYRKQSAMAEQGASKPANPQLQKAYQKMQHVTSSSLIKVVEFEKLLNTLGGDIRQMYQTALPVMVKKGMNPPQGKAIDMAVKSAQVQFELGMLLGGSPPPAFLPLIRKLFTHSLPVYRNTTDPAKVFFGDFDLLGVLDDKSSLAARRVKNVYVDLFKRSQLQQGTGHQWRRCTRCASVMEDVSVNRPGFSFVLTQQNKCSCGGNWSLLPRGKLML